jgi:mannose-6-phosphate isomerase-like protein (cupin superfamily)
VADGLVRGTLAAPGAGPASGEEVRALVAARGLVVEQILSGRLEAPVEYAQREDEWVVLLAGRAVLATGGETIELGPGDWLYLPSGLPHTLVETEPGSSWLAVRIAAA